MNILRTISLFWIISLFGCNAAKLQSNRKIISASLYNKKDITSTLVEILSQNPKEIIFEKGEYKISSYIHIFNKNKLKIKGNGSTISFLNLPPNSNPGMFKIFKSKDITINNLNINNSFIRDESSYLISAFYIIDSKDVIIDRCEIKNRIGDGIHIASTNENEIGVSSRIQILNCNIDSSGRNGISIVNGKDILIKGGRITNTNGQHPQAGIDIESNPGDPWQGIKNVIIEDIVITRNMGNGIGIPHISCPTNIRINNCTISNNLSGVWSCGVNVSISSCEIFKNKSYGICSIRYPEFNIPPDSLKILNCNIHHNDVGIQYRGSGGLIQGNTISNMLNEGIEAIYMENTLQDVIISYNNLSKINGRNAITSNFSRVEINKNVIDSCDNGGIAIYRGEADIKNNSIKNCLGHGISVSDAMTNIYDNQIRNVNGYFLIISDGEKGGNRFNLNKVNKNKFSSYKSAKNNYVIMDSGGRISELNDNTFRFPTRQKILTNNVDKIFNVNGADIIK